MKWLVDAIVLSEVTKARPCEKVSEWVQREQNDIVIDPIILDEILFGILILPDGKRKDRLLFWFDEFVAEIRCVPWDCETSAAWSNLKAGLRKNGIGIPLIDSMIAASAIRYRLTIVTRNVADFRATGLPVFDPFAGEHFAG